MKKYEALVAQCKRVDVAVTALDRMTALYGLRQLLQEPLDVLLSVEVQLSDLEQFLPEGDKPALRVLGYQFPEDFDEPKRMFCE